METNYALSKWRTLVVALSLAFHLTDAHLRALT